MSLTELLAVSLVCSALMGLVVMAAFQEKNGGCRLSSADVFRGLSAALLFFAVLFVAGVFQIESQKRNSVHVNVDPPKWISDGNYENVNDGQTITDNPAEATRNDIRNNYMSDYPTSGDGSDVHR